MFYCRNRASEKMTFLSYVFAEIEAALRLFTLKVKQTISQDHDCREVKYQLGEAGIQAEL